MALHPNFPESPYAILDPAIRWFPADEALARNQHGQADAAAGAATAPEGEGMAGQRLRRARRTPAGACSTGGSTTPHLLPQADGTMAEFQYYFAQREALETIIYLYDVVGVKDKYDLMRFDSSRRRLRRHVRRDLAALRGEDGDRRGQDQGAEPGAGVEFLITSCTSRIPNWRATFW